MKRNYTPLLSVLFTSFIVFGIYFTMMPQWIPDSAPLSEFSTKRALEHIKIIAEKPHFVGSQNHTVVSSYVETELQKLGLETTIQEGTTLSDWGNLVKSKNILARIKGTGNDKALLLLSHYDSAPHSSSHGASDDASGVATILEGLRAFLHNKTPHKNDIVILFSDAEELGLNGAALFVTQHQWAKEIGLAINFEARGSSGPGYMLMEINQGNANMVAGFKEANPQYPVSNSLMYSIYKMLPNDTDLTVFRKFGNIQGFNFAFIDGHYNYHSAQDDYNHISHETVAHQGSYLMPLLSYFSNADLQHLNSTEDAVYFNTPFYFFSYPFDWILPMWIGSLLLFLFLVFIGIGKRILIVKEIVKGFLYLLAALSIAGMVNFFGWKIMLGVYPQYNDMLNGFTYNGHAYIAAFVFLSIAIALLAYSKSATESLAANHSVAPLFLWICINFGIAFYLPGAGFFIIPVYSGLLMLAYFIITQRTNLLLNLLLSVPILVILVPFIAMFPIGLGLKILAGSAALTVLVFALLLPLFGTFPKKGIWALLFIAGSVGFFTKAHLDSGYSKGKAKSNSLLYIYDSDKDKAFWATYDINPDEWTENYLGNHPKNAVSINDYPLFSKYGTPISKTNDALVREIPEPSISFLKDSVIGNYRYLKLRISSDRKVNRYDIFANPNMVIHNLKANGASALDQHGSKYLRHDRDVLRYYIVNNEPLELEFSIPKNTVLDMSLMESSFDLMSNPLFDMEKRKSWMMPTPFVLNDAIIVKKKIAPAAKFAIAVPIQKNLVLNNQTAINDTIPDPDEKN